MKQGVLFTVLVCVCICYWTAQAGAMDIRTSAFNDGGSMPLKYTVFGLDHSPDLEWIDVPEGTVSFAVVMFDPDAPHGDWVHWVIYDMPADTRYLAEDAGKILIPANGSKQGMNSFGKLGYIGPYPPPGPSHRYIFDLYALDSYTGLGEGATSGDLEKAMAGHIIGRARITGMFKRQ